MLMFNDKNEYIKGFYNEIQKNPKADKLLNYIDQQVNQLEVLIEKLNKETFWEIFPRILGIDAKLCLVTGVADLITTAEFSEEEIIRLAESDYTVYYKELCGYNLNEETINSMIFNIL